MKSVETLKQKLINKRSDLITDSEPRYLKEERRKIAEEKIRKSKKFYFNSQVHPLLTELRGLLDNFSISTTEVWYQENGKLNPHFSVNLIWDHRQDIIKPGIGIISNEIEKGETHKEITINSFPNGDIAIKGHLLLGSSKFYYLSETAEKALIKGIKHPKIKWEANRR